MMKWFLISSLLVSQSLFAATSLSCMSFVPPTPGWTDSIVMRNQCGTAVNLQNGLITFSSNHSLKGNYWGNFGNLAYPQNPALSSATTQGGYLVQIPLTFPTGDQWWKPNTILAAGAAITVSFSATPTTTISNIKFYPITSPTVQTGQISIQYPSSPDASIGTPSAVTISDGSGYQKIVNGQWGSQSTVSSVPYGTYQVTVASITSSGVTWTGSASPASVTVNSSTTQTSNISYAKSIQYGSIKVSLNQAAPETPLNTPVLQVKDLTTGTTLPTQNLAWSSSVTVSNLNPGTSYQLSIANVDGLNNTYTASFSPSDTVAAQANVVSNVTASFNSSPLPTTPVSVSVKGLPSGQSITLSATDNLGHSYQQTSGNTSALAWTLPVNRQYQFSASSLNANNIFYKATVTPATILLQTGGSPTLAVSYSQAPIVTEFSPYVDVTLNEITQWDNTTNSMQPNGLITLVKNSGVKGLHLAFITASGGCNGTWNGYPVTSDANGYGVAVLKQLRQQGTNITVALGGANGTYLEQACTNVNDLLSVYKTIMTAYQPTTLDFDIENAMQGNNAQLDMMMQALVQLKQQYPNLRLSFTLPVMPDGLVSGWGLNVLQRAKNAGLSDYLVNVMAMDYGSSFTAETMGNYAIDAATATFNQLKTLYPSQSDAVLWQRVGVTPMIGLNDTMPLNFTLADVQTLSQFANSKQLGLLSFWSINRDHSCVNANTSITCSSSDPKTKAANQTVDYQYSKGFLGQ